MNLKLLKEILNKHEPDLVNIFESDLYKEIDADLGNHIRNILGDEFVETGMNDSLGNEINERGREIEQLIDDIGNLFM